MKKTLFFTTLIVIFSFAFSFALVPLYNVFCQTLGLSNKVKINQLEVMTKNPQTNFSRAITVQFISTNNAGLPWDFSPEKNSMQTFTGKKTKIIFIAKNNTKTKMTVQAIVDITPSEAIKHFHKIECFCFQQQSLKGNESKKMPVVFYIDDQLPKSLHTITLAYTLFDVTKGLKK